MNESSEKKKAFNDHNFKILLYAPSGVGKENLFQDFMKNGIQANYKLTVGVDIFTKDIEYEPGKRQTISIWNLSSQTRFDFIRSRFYKGTSGAIIIFDVSKPNTLEQAKQFLEEIQMFGFGHIPFVLIGNNFDLKNKETKTKVRYEANLFAQNEGGFYIETSNKAGFNIEYAIKEILNLLMKK